MKGKGAASISSASTLSTSEITNIVEQLKSQRCRDSTRQMYHKIWKLFAVFYAKLDRKPIEWSDRLVLFTAYLIDKNMQSSTVRSYVSAIKSVLAEDGIFINTDTFLLTSLTRACKLINDRIVIHRFPIYKGLLHQILDNIEKHFDGQLYLTTMYKAMFLASYYGLLRAGEVATGPHVLRAKDTFIGKNKRKFLFILWTSKTHGRGSKPQRIKISSSRNQNTKHCPFEALRKYSKIRPQALNKNEQFFVFADCTPVSPLRLRKILKDALVRMNYNSDLYNLHSLRIGRCGDLYKLGLSVETIKKIGRWKSNAVFAYLRD